MAGQCVGHSYAYVAHLVFLRDVWITTQRAAVESRRATNLATHITILATHLPNLATQRPSPAPKPAGFGLNPYYLHLKNRLVQRQTLSNL
jgi:hypothetical protein